MGENRGRDGTRLSRRGGEVSRRSWSRPALVAALVTILLASAVGPAAAGRVLVFRGRGWGHGIGMSQYGALGRALAGHSARRILLHYYSGARLRRVRLPRKIRVGLLQYRKVVHVSSRARSGRGRGVWKVAGARRRVAAGGRRDRWAVRPAHTGGVRLFRNGAPVRRRGRAVFGSLKRPLEFHFFEHGSAARVRERGLAYAYGKLQFSAHGSCGDRFCLRVVLKLPFHKYVYGLGEVPASWPHAALAAQAVAGRTYALRSVRDHGQHREPCDCAVYDTPLDQAYIGDAKRTESGPYWFDWKRAVDATRGRVLMNRGKPIHALYSSSSGGHTENIENVWGGPAIRYLRGVRDRFDGVRSNPNYRWRTKMSWKRAARRLDRAFGIGWLRRIRLVRPFGVSGRVTVAKPRGRGGVRLVGSAASVRVDAWAVRSVLDLNDTWFRIRVRRVPRRATTSPERCRGLPERTSIGSGLDGLGRLATGAVLLRRTESACSA
jgi:stage II sporulation protein D